jgi:DNA-binding NarL/FixJ family response regulator
MVECAASCRKFLLVEDNSGVAKTLGRWLSAFGDVEHCANFEEAQIALPRSTWRGMVIDVRLPDGSGFEIVRDAREAGVACEILVLTGVLDGELARQAHMLDATYLVKPCSMDALQKFVDRAMHDSTSVDVSLWTKRYNLTPTEAQVLLSAAGGNRRKDLIQDRTLSSATVKQHVRNLLKKTGDLTLASASIRLLRERM